jgi:hypothetical protein
MTRDKTVGDEIDRLDAAKDESDSMVQKLQHEIDGMRLTINQLQNRCWVFTYGVVCRNCGWKDTCTHGKEKLKDDDPR